MRRKAVPSKSPARPAVLVVAHGSREASANRAFVSLVRLYRERHPGWFISHAFLELASPSIPSALARLSKSSDQITVLPFFLFSAKHVKKSIPRIMRDFRRRHPHARLRLAPPLGNDQKLLDLLDHRLKTP